jgi:2-haloacid dehalogenase
VHGRQPVAVAFDLHGVLIDWDPRYLYRRLFADPADMEDFLARIATADWYREHDLGADIAGSCRRLARRHPAHREMIMAWAERGEEMVAGQFDQTVQVLAELKAAGIRCYALSNMEPDALVARRARFPFMESFDGYVISGMERVAKPDRRIFEILLRRYGLEPRATVFVDDVAQNVEAARALNMYAVQYVSARRLRQQLRSLGLTELRPPRAPGQRPDPGPGQLPA